MKKFYTIPIALTAFAFLLSVFSCEKQEVEKKEKGNLEISINLDEPAGNLKTAKEDTVMPGHYHLIVTILNEEGMPVMEDEMIPLYSFGSGYVSNRIELETGSYRLTKFFVVNPENSVIYASPHEGSPKAYLVKNPLPLEFNIEAGQLSRIMPQVLPVGDSYPSDFGYASFGFQVVIPLPVYAVAVSENPLIMAPTQFIRAELKVLTSNGWRHRFILKAEVNKFFVPAGAEFYQFVIYNEAYGQKTFRFSERQLRASSEDKPLILRIGEQMPNRIILQPGPEDGKDATITDLNPDRNMGSYKWFEASFVSEPILTVMRTKRSLIQFDLNALPKSARIDSVFLTLHFEKPLWDSIIIMNDQSPWIRDDLFVVLQQVIEPWSEYEVTWNNQPPTIEANQVFIPFRPEMSTNMRMVDVTSLFVPIAEIAAPNHGMMLKIPEPENWFGMQFASSDHPVPEMRPRLTVFYSYYSD